MGGSPGLSPSAGWLGHRPEAPGPGAGGHVASLGDGAARTELACPHGAGEAIGSPARHVTS